jgi:predicted permease
MLADLRFALRRLRHAPGFTIVAILTLAVAVGANTAILTIADGVLFRPLPFRDADRVFLIQMADRTSGQHYTQVQYGVVRAVADLHSGLGEVGMSGSGPSVLEQTPEGLARVPTHAASAAYLRVLGVTPALGRLFADSDTPGRTALLSSAAWRTRFGSDRSTVGKTVTIGSSSFDVVGVLPSGFQFPSYFAGKPEIVTLMAPVPVDAKGGTFHPVVRLEPGVSREQAQAELETITAPLFAGDPRMKNVVPSLDSIRETIYPVGRPVMRFLLAAAALVLLIAAANLANMMLARNRRLERETAVRSALGASRGRLVRPLVLEAAVIGLGGAALALVVTALSFDAMLRLVPNVVYSNAEIGVDWRVALIGLGLGLAGGLVFAVVPAWRSARLDVLALIQGRAHVGGGGVRLGRPLLAVQVAIAIVLVFGAVVATRAFVGVLQTPLGFEPDRVVRIGISPARGADIVAFYRQVGEALSARPGVLAVGASGAPPLGGSVPWAGIRVQEGGNRVAGIVHATPGYFDAVGIRLLKGRQLSWEDAVDGTAAVASESAVRALFGSAEPMEQVVHDETKQARRIVGVVSDVRGSLDRESMPPVYAIPVGRAAPLTVFARVHSNQAAILADLRREAGRLQPAAVVPVAWWTDVLGELTAYKNPRFQTTVLSAFAGIALGLTALGVFGVVAFLVASRAREMGIRLAIGAAPASLVRLVARQTLIPVGIGLVVGLIATRWAARLAEAQLFKVETRDPWLLALTAATVLAAALVAAYLPARRAARVDPLVVLRAE